MLYYASGGVGLLIPPNNYIMCNRVYYIYTAIDNVDAVHSGSHQLHASPHLQ